MSALTTTVPMMDLIPHRHSLTIQACQTEYCSLTYECSQHRLALSPISTTHTKKINFDDMRARQILQLLQQNYI